MALVMERKPRHNSLVATTENGVSPSHRPDRSAPRTVTTPFGPSNWSPQLHVMQLPSTNSFSGRPTNHAAPAHHTIGLRGRLAIKFKSHLKPIQRSQAPGRYMSSLGPTQDTSGGTPLLGKASRMRHTFRARTRPSKPIGHRTMAGSLPAKSHVGFHATFPHSNALCSNSEFIGIGNELLGLTETSEAA